MSSDLASLLSWLQKQSTTITSAGTHEHPGYSGVHPISQHHRHGATGDFTVPEEYWKDPTYFDEEQQEERPQQINITQIARAHGLDMRSLHRAMQQKYGANRLSSQVMENEYYDPDKEKIIKVREIMLTPSQVQTAHQLATELKRRSGRMTRPMRIIRPATVRQTSEPLFAMEKWLLEKQKRAYHTDDGKYPYHPVRVIDHEDWFATHRSGIINKPGKTLSPKYSTRAQRGLKPRTTVAIHQNIVADYPEINDYILQILEKNSSVISPRLREIRILKPEEIKQLGTLVGRYKETLGVYFFDKGLLTLNQFYFKHFQRYKHDFEMTLIHEASHALWHDLPFDQAQLWKQLWRDEIKNNDGLDIYGQDDPLEAFPELITQIRRSDAPNAKKWFKEHGAKRSVEFLEKRGFV